MILAKEKLFVALGSEINPSRFHQLSESAKLEQLEKPRGLMYQEVKSLREAREILMKFNDHFNLGGSESTGGNVINENGDHIAFISYNGRIWESEEYPSKEITNY